METTGSTASKDIMIFAAGNPLLDISVELSNNDLLTKYELAHGQASLAGDKQLPLYPEIMAMEGRQLIPGGSALNTIRAVNFALQGKGTSAYMGCIGKDKTGETLE
jgi:adenosine kinase